MTSICHACATDVTDDHIACQGFCKAIFHPRCSGIAPHIMNEILRTSQIFWLCQSCSSLMRDMRLRNTVRSAYELGQEKVLGHHDDIIESLKSEILTELKAEIKSNFAALINSSSMTPKTIKRPSFVQISTRSRRLFGPQNDEAKQTKLKIGTCGSISPSLGISTVSTERQKFWLYLSRISCNVSVDQIRTLAQQRLGTEDVDVVKLVAKGRDINTLSFVSFKIGMKTDLKNKALCPSTWPKGIYFREFSDNRSNENFWQPLVTSNQQNHPSKNGAQTVSPMVVNPSE